MEGDGNDAVGFDTVLVVEDDPALRARLQRLVAGVDAAADVALAGDLAQAQALLREREFALALIDVGLPDGSGIDLIARLRAQHPATQALVVSSWGDEHTVIGALRAGAIGYLLKERDDLELTVSLRSIQRGGAPIDPVIARRILAMLPGVEAKAPSPQSEVRLSEREYEVLQLLARGYSNREIADMVSLSKLTIEGYTKAIYRKLAVGSRTAAVFEAKSLGLLD